MFEIISFPQALPLPPLAINLIYHAFSHPSDRSRPGRAPHQLPFPELRRRRGIQQNDNRRSVAETSLRVLAAVRYRVVARTGSISGRPRRKDYQDPRRAWSRARAEPTNRPRRWIPRGGHGADGDAINSTPIRAGEEYFVQTLLLSR